MIYKKYSVGFSLIELVLVLGIISVIVALAVNSIQFMYRLKVRSEAERIVALLVSLQAIALGTGQKQELLVNLEQHAFIRQKQIERLADGVLFSILPGAYGPPSRPTERLTSACTFLDNCIQFYPDGTITSGALYITDKAHTTLYAITVPVDAVRYIRLYKYIQGSWQIIDTS